MAETALTEGINLFLLLLFLLPFLFLIFKHFIFASKPALLPPGPYPWPIIGNIHQIGKQRHIAMTNIAKTYGPLFSLKLGSQTVVVGSSAAAAKEILSSYDRILCGRYVFQVSPRTPEFKHASVGWTPNCDERWKYLRAMCRTQLFSGKAIESQASLREKKVVEVIKFLCTMEGKAVELKKVAMVTSLNMMSNVLLSKDLVSLEDESSVAGIGRTVQTIMETLAAPNIADYYPILSGLDLQRLYTKSRDCFQMLCSLWLQSTIKERREGKGSNTTSQQDFLDTLIDDGCTDFQINTLLVELLVAGIDSTSVTTEWAMAELITSPESMKKVREELGREMNQNMPKDSDLRKLPYLQACVKETLRLHPPGAFLLPHRALESCKVMNYTIPKDAQVLVNAWAIGRDPMSWEDPLVFKPERFLNSSVDFQGKNFEFIPFSAGRRICPGLPMAVKMIPLVLASWVHFFDWSLPDGGDPKEIDMSEIYSANIRKEQPLLLIPKIRN